MYDLKTLEYNKIIDILKPYAKTDYALRQIEQMQPADNYDDIVKLLNETKEAYQAIVKYNDIPLGGLRDVKDAIRRSEIGGILSPMELLDVVGLLDASANVIRYFKDLANMKLEPASLKAYSDKLVLPQALKTNITLAITPEGAVADNASRELFMIRRNITSLSNRLKSKLNEMLQSRAAMLTEPLIVIRDGRMCLPVKVEYKNTFKGIIHDISSSNTTVYIEPEITFETANQIESYKLAEQKEINVILKSLSLLVAGEAECLLVNLEALTNLDLIFARALMGKANDYNEVIINNTQSFNLKKAKHPLIDKDKVVPIDIELGKHFDAIIITGPNTGGKTVALKTVGLLHLMVFSGMMVPVAENSEFGYFDNILADIGDEQSIEQSLSTFSSHMTRIISILSEVGFESLILLDELGSGTDPKEGSSLAIAIIDFLKSAGAKLISTTHYSELKNYAYNHERVCNASVEFNTQTLMPTYRLLLGVPGKSNAIDVASRLGLSPKIIEAARAEMESTSSGSQVLMANLEEEITLMREKEEELQKKLIEADKTLKTVQQEKMQIIKSTDKIMADAKKQANDVLIKAKEDAEKLLDEIKAMSEADYKDHELADLKHKVNSLEVNSNDEQIFDEELNEGDYVYIKSYDKNGLITKVKKDKYTVAIGQFQMDFKKSELIKASKPAEKQVRKTRMSGYNPASHAALSLDLRGKRYEDVKDLMDQYLDQAILGNLHTVTIVHGFGTGTIRKAVQEYLKTCPYVKSYRYGQEGEGLNGVTVVTLK